MLEFKLTPKCYWMIGISGSGKSSVAKQINKHTGAIIISSNEVRAKLYGDESIQGNSQDVFNKVHNNIINYLNNGISVIYDATNISLKNRLKFFNQLKDLNIIVEHHAIVMSKSIKQCIIDNKNRDRIVPEDVIRKQACQFNMPFFEEGFKTITIYGWDGFERVTKDDERYISQSIINHTNLIGMMDKFNQNNPHHELTLGDHCDKVYNIVKSFSNDISLLTASNIHDIGKLYTEEKDKKGISHYYNHAEVGTYNLLQNLDALNVSAMRLKDVIKTLFYCNYHMRPFDWNNEQIHDKYRKIFGKENYNNLWLLHNADIRGCKKNDEDIFKIKYD
jgi:predicted kinase